MGTKLSKAFDIVANEGGGVQGKMRLAMKSGMSQQKAGGEPDSPENIQKMEAALKEVLGKNFRL